jgi:hypothetical protein
VFGGIRAGDFDIERLDLRPLRLVTHHTLKLAAIDASAIGV